MAEDRRPAAEFVELVEKLLLKLWLWLREIAEREEVLVRERMDVTDQGTFCRSRPRQQPDLVHVSQMRGSTQEIRELGELLP
jgi:hypothetical protein